MPDPWDGPEGQTQYAQDTWTCQVCSRERPDAAISVYKDSAPIAPGRSELTVNVRYCNDDPTCLAGAPDVARRWLEASRGDR